MNWTRWKRKRKVAGRKKFTGRAAFKEMAKKQQKAMELVEIFSQPSSSTISSYISNNPSPNYYSGSSMNAFNAPIMQAAAMNLNNVKTYSVGIGFGTDYDFLDRLARTGKTSYNNGQAPRNTGDPSQYEQKLKDIFQNIIVNAGVRLVN